MGRLLGFAMHAPAGVRVLDDLIDAGSGLELVECAPDELTPASTLIAIIRGERRLPADQVDVTNVRPGERLAVMRESAAHR